jgi:23S rRNA pseudouridine2605 synthase
MSTSSPPSNAEGERVAKFLARAGVCSRRDAERLIAEGRVKLNGKVLDTPAVKVTAKDKVSVDGRPIGAAEPTRLWRFHKPSGLVTTHRDPAGRATVFEHLPRDMPRVISVGRLDLTSEGLLLLTNDAVERLASALPCSCVWAR